MPRHAVIGVGAGLAALAALLAWQGGRGVLPPSPALLDEAPSCASCNARHQRLTDAPAPSSD